MRKGIWRAVAALAVIVPGGALLAGPAAQAADTMVSIDDSNNDTMKWGYAPAQISVAVGSTVMWHNDGKQPHTVSADDKSFDSPYLNGGGEFSYTFASPGEFSYYCKPHPWMKGVVKVTGSAAAPAPAPAPTETTVTTSAPAPAPANASAAAPTTTTTAKAGTTTTTTAAAAPGADEATTTTTAAPAAAAPAEGETTTTTGVAAPEGGEEATADSTEEAETTAAPASSGPKSDRDAAAIIFGIGASLAVALIAVKLLFTKSASAAH